MVANLQLNHGRLLLNNNQSLTVGSGVPVAAEADGSIYLRNDGTDATTIYVRVSGAWVLLPSGGGVAEPDQQMVYGTGAAVDSNEDLRLDTTVVPKVLYLGGVTDDGQLSITGGGPAILIDMTASGGAMTARKNGNRFFSCNSNGGLLLGEQIAAVGGSVVLYADLGAGQQIFSQIDQSKSELIGPLKVRHWPGGSSTDYLAIFTDVNNVEAWGLDKDGIQENIRHNVQIKNAGTFNTLTGNEVVVLADTSGGNLTITLNPTPFQGEIVTIKNVKGAGATLTINRNGKKIDNAAANLTTAVNNAVFRLVYDSTYEWALL